MSIDKSIERMRAVVDRLAHGLESFDKTARHRPEEHGISASASSNSHPEMGIGGASNWVPAGHFYSPIPRIDEVNLRREQIWRNRTDLPGIDFNLPRQRQLLRELKQFYDDLPFTDAKTPDFRYHYDNGLYGWGDGVFYACMLRYLKPARAIEVGSGYSSALALDVNDFFLEKKTRFTFIEPFADLPFELSDEIDLIRQPVQDLDLSVFQTLKSGDILFIDSTHVSKIGSDVNFLFLDIIPSLAPGVFIHIHDVFLNFEYPEKWIREGRAWNEQYLLRALLCNSSHLEIVLMSGLVHEIDAEWLLKEMPNTRKNPGASIWLRTVDPEHPFLEN
jgi:Methyltransferase domain